MKSLNVRICRFAINIAVVFALPASECALSAAAPVSPAEAQAIETAVRATVAEAKNFVSAGNIDAAEQSLQMLSRAKPETAAWHLDTARHLAHLAFDSGREGKSSSAPILAAKALQHVQRADALVSDTRQRASAKMLSGFIYERLLGDPKAARECFQAAAQLAPDSPTAKEKVEHLRRVDETMARQSSAPQN